MDNCLATLTFRSPTDDEVGTCDVIELNSPTRWNPAFLTGDNFYPGADHYAKVPAHPNAYVNNPNAYVNKTSTKETSTETTETALQDDTTVEVTPDVSKSDEPQPFFWYEGRKIYDCADQFAYEELDCDVAGEKIPSEHIFEVEQWIKDTQSRQIQGVKTKFKEPDWNRWQRCLR